MHQFAQTPITLMPKQCVSNGSIILQKAVICAAKAYKTLQTTTLNPLISMTYKNLVTFFLKENL